MFRKGDFMGFPSISTTVQPVPFSARLGLLEPAPGPVMILGIHLCGALVIEAMESGGK